MYVPKCIALECIVLLLHDMLMQSEKITTAVYI